MKWNFRWLATVTLVVALIGVALRLMAGPPPPKDSKLVVTPNPQAVTVRLQLEAGTNPVTYVIQMSTNLVNWKTLLAVKPQPGKSFPLGELPATNHAAFFRLVGFGSITETNPPVWSNGVQGQVTFTPPAGLLASWTAATDDTGVAEYRLYLNGVLITNVVGTTLSYDFKLSGREPADLRIQAVDPFGNATDILSLAYLPGDKLLAVSDDSGRVYTSYILTNGNFSPFTQIASYGANDRGLCLGDFDRDGLTDLVAGYPSGDTLVPFFYKGKGDGTFAPGIRLPTASGTSGYVMDATAGDFDGDGNLDFVFNGNERFVMFYWGNGDGTFKVEVKDWGDGAYYYGRGMAAGDFNEDGREDIARATYGSGYVKVLLSKGDRTFIETNLVAQSVGNNDPYGVAAGDFDEDGHLDLLIAGGNSGDVTFLKGLGNGSFTNVTGTNGLWANLKVNTYSGMDAFDYNSDGHLDLVMTTYGGQAYFWAGNGDGTFSTNRVTLNTGMSTSLGISAPTRPARVDVRISPLDPVTNLNGTIQFTASGAGVAPGDNFLWSFGDTGTNPYAWTFTNGMANMGQAVAHAYTNEGRFLTRLLHTDSHGILSARGTWVTVQGAPPVAQPGGPYAFGEIAATQAVWYATLDGSASTDDFGIVSYIWTFGDGASVTNGPRVLHGWAGPGSWDVGLTVVDASGLSGSNHTTITFTPGDPPVAVISGPDVVDETSAANGVWSASFNAANATDDVGIWKYEWNFGNGQTASGRSVSTTYGAVGSYDVTLKVTDNANQTNSTTHNVLVKANDPPVPVITGSHFLTEAVATNGLWFGAWNGSASTDDRGIYQYNWKFGDGGTASGAAVTHNYAGAGIYPLVLTVTDFGNQTVSLTQNVIVVVGDLPVARITASTLAPEGAQPVDLSGINSSDDYGILSYRWLLPPQSYDFAGATLDVSRWTVANTTQDGKLITTGQNNWGGAYFYTTGLQVSRGSAIEARVDTPTGTSHAMMGLRNQDNGSGHYDRLVYAIYFADGGVQIYEYGGYRGTPTTYSQGTSYDIRIETKTTGGAIYYLRPTGAGVPFVKIFETSNYSDGNFGVGGSIYDGVFGFDDLKLTPTYGFRDVSASVFPGGPVTLIVTDHALQTNSASIVINSVTGAPPIAVINGPTNGLAGVELAFDGYRSSDDHAIASYNWDFGDGTPVVTGPAVSHHYAVAGTYTNTLTVFDYAGQSNSAALPVTATGGSLLLHVPWQIVGGIELPHEVYSGKTNSLKAVARSLSAPFTYIWEFGDGSGSVTNDVTAPAEVYNLEAQHAYTGSDGTPFYATVTLVNTNGTLLRDTYPLLIRPKTLDVEMKVAIDEGLWYLHKIQTRYNIDTNHTGGYWTYAAYGTYHLNVSASAVQAFGINGHVMTDDAARDPYVDTVQRGVNYLLSRLTTIGIGPQAYGDPDGNHNGIGLTSPDDHAPYETGPLMDALVAVGRPELVAAVGGPNVKGRSFRDLMQDMVDVYAWGQSDNGYGGWIYSWQDVSGDNSASQWAAIGMMAAERFWGIAAPTWVKERNNVWVAATAGGSGYGYRGPGDGEATTPSALVQLAWEGVPTTNALWLHGESFLANNWSALMSYNNVYANYAIAKSLRSANPPVHNLSPSGKDWFRDPTNGLARTTIDRQRSDGTWFGSGRGFENDIQEATAWSTIILSSSLFQRGPVAVINTQPNPSAVGYPVVFDARSSYHQHPAYKVVDYRWDFDAANGVDFEHPDAVGPVVTNFYGTLSTNVVSLQVRDNATPALRDVASVVVRTTVPPFPPSADAGGPYVVCVGQDVHLDGSGSFCVDAASGNFIQSWDWEIDFLNPLNFSDGVSGPHAVITNGYPTAGQHSLGLRVKNANSIVYPSFGLPDLTADAFTTVFVYDRVISDLTTRPKGNKIQLTWTKVGDYAVVQRSTLGPDRGFGEVGRTDNSYATFLDTNVQYNVEYYYRIFAYGNSRPDPVGVSDASFVVSRQRGLEDHPPKFLSTPLRLAVVGQLYGETLDAKDPENDPITFNLLTGPTNLTVNPGSGVIQFIPTQEQIGSHFLSFEATNAAGRDVLSFNLFVFPASNHPPVVAIGGPYAALTGTTIQFSSAGTSDPDGDNLNYFWNFGDGQSATNPNPAHVYNAAGDYLVTLFVNDGFGGTASARTHAQLLRPNRPPTATVAGGPHFSLRLGETLTLDGSASFDLDGDPLAFEWSWGDGATDRNAALKFSHVYAATGLYRGQLVVADNRGGQGSYNFDATVAPPNQAPAIAMLLSTNSPFVLTTVTFDATGSTDPENDPLTFEWDFGDHFKTTGPLVTHAYRQIADFTAVLKVSDGRGGVSVATQTVHAVNAPPVFTSIPPLLVKAGHGYTYTPTISDVDGDAASFSLVQGPTTMTINTNTGALDWLPGTNDVGPNAIHLRATDANGASADQSFSLVVTTPTGPEVDLELTSIVMTNVFVESQSLQYTGSVRVLWRNNGADAVPVPYTVSVFVDADGDGVYSTNADRLVGYAFAPAGLTQGSTAFADIPVRGEALFAGAPLSAFVDSESVVPEYDESNNLRRAGFDVNTNNPPVLDVSASRLEADRTGLPASVLLSARFGNAGFVPVPAGVGLAFYLGDPASGGSLLGVAHSGADLAPGQFETVSVTWSNPPIAKHTIFVVADDNGSGGGVLAEITKANNKFSAEADFTVNAPPVAQAGPDQTINLGDVAVLNGRGSSDPEGKPLTFLWSFVSIPIGSHPQLSGETTVQAALQPDAAGPYTLRLVVNDGVNDSAPDEVVVTVVDLKANHVPAITSTPPFSGMVNVLYQYAVQASDPDGDTLHFRLPQAPPGMILNPNTGLIQWSPTNAGTFFVQLAVDDGRGASAIQSWSLNVTVYSNVPPQFTSTPVTSATPGAAYNYNAVAADPNLDLLTYALTQNPSGMSISAQSGAITWTPTPGQMGGHTVTVTASDGHGGTATQTFNLVVLTAGADGPVVQAMPDQTVVDSDAFAAIPLDSYVNDPNYPDDQIVWTVTGNTQLAVVIDANRVATVTYAPGTRTSERITFLATDPAGKSGFASPLLVVRGVDNPPVAAIANLSDTETTGLNTGFFELTGTADDPDAVDAVAYRVGLFEADGAQVADVTPPPVNAAGWHEGRVGTGGSLGTLDLTRVRNGAYTLMLEVQGGVQTANATALIAVDSPLKLGQMRFSQQDLVLPVLGVGLQVNRFYDSFNPTAADFGYSWTYSVADLELKINEQRSLVQDVFEETFSLRTGGSRDVTLTMPDTGRRVTFRYSLEPAGLFKMRATWTPPPGINATLATTVSPILINIQIYSQSLTYWQAGPLETSLENFDFPGFILTTADGTQYRIDRENLGSRFMDSGNAIGSYVDAYGQAFLTRITQPGGEHTEFIHQGTDLKNIAQFDNANHPLKSILFQRDSQNRIARIYTPENLDTNGVPVGPASVTYDYDSAGNLIHANKLTDASNPSQLGYATTSFVYGHPRFPHFITEIQDPRGVTVLRAQFDASGRLVGTTDANGNVSTIDNNISGRTTTVFDRQGNPTQYTYDERGNVVARTDALGRTTLETYDAQNNPTSISDPLGNTVRLAYDSSNKPTAVTDPMGNRTGIVYDDNGRPSAITDPLGHTTTNVFDAQGKLLAISNPLGQGSTFQYDGAGRAASVVDARGHPALQYQYDGSGNATTVVPASGPALSLTYDNDGHPLTSQYQWVNPSNSNDVRTVSASLTYDSAGRVIRSVDGVGNQTTTTYNETGDTVAITDALNNVTTNLFDLMGHLVQRGYPDGSVDQYVYDENGRVVLAVDRHAPGQVALATRTLFDVAGQIIELDRHTNVVVTITPVTAGSITAYKSSFASSGGVLFSNVMVYDAAGRMISSTDPTGQMTRYEYNAAGRRTAVIDPLASRVELEYDAAGHNTLVRDPQGREVHNLYDSAGRLARTVYPDGSSTSSTYDENGRPVTRTDAQNRTRQYQYDDAGHLTNVVLPAVVDPENTNALIQPVYQYEYDAYGNLAKMTDPKGRQTTFTFDAFQRPTSQTLPAGEVNTTRYDQYGRVQMETDAQGQATETRYDPLGRIVGRNYYAAGSNSPSDQITLDYDPLSLRLAKVVDSVGATTFDYDAGSHVTEIATPEGTVHYDYDAATGMRIRTWTANTDIRFGYDKLIRLQTVTVVKRNGVPLSTPEVTTYEYNAVGTRSAVVLPNGVRTDYTYDQMNRLTLLRHLGTNGLLLASFAYQHGPNNLRTGLTEIVRSPGGAYQTNSITYVYDGLDRLTAETAKDLSDGTTYRVTYTYDLAGNRLERAATTGGKTLKTFYAYDANDRLIMESNLVSAAAAGAQHGALTTPIRIGGRIAPVRILYSPLVGAFCYYAFKALPYGLFGSFLIPALVLVGRRGRKPRLFTADLCPQRAIFPRCVACFLAVLMALFSFDMRTMANQAILYSALQTDTWGLDGSVTTYQHDANGAVIAKTTTGPKAQNVVYGYDLAHRLVSAATTRIISGSTVVDTAKYTYNVQGIKVGTETRQLVDGVEQTSLTNLFLIDTLNHTFVPQVLEELPAAGAAPTSSYTLGADIVEQSHSDGPSFLLRDGHGSTRLLTDASGQITDVYAYDAFGMMLGGNPTPANPARTKLLYNGQHFDDQLGQYYLRARVYDPGNGRFNSQDPLPGSPQDPVSLHRYTYALNDPVNRVDPTGQQSLGDVMCVVAIVGILATMAMGTYSAHQGGDYNPDAAIWGSSISIAMNGAIGGIASIALGSIISFITSESDEVNLSQIWAFYSSAGASGAGALQAWLTATLPGLLGGGSPWFLVAQTATLGYEWLATATDRQFGAYWYYALGPAFGRNTSAADVSITNYGGVCWHVKGWDKYSGYFQAVGLTVGLGGYGAVGGLFRSPNDPLQFGLIIGFTASFSGSTGSSVAFNGSFYRVLFDPVPMSNWYPFIFALPPGEGVPLALKYKGLL